MTRKIKFNAQVTENVKTKEVEVYEFFKIDGILCGVVFSKFKDKSEFERHKGKLWILKKTEKEGL